MLRLAIAQLRPRKGAYRENLDRLGALLGELAGRDEPPELVLLPESALTGYFLEGGVREAAVSAEQLFDDLSARHAAAGCAPLDVALGFYEVWQNRLYNSALYASLGGPDAGIRHVHRKIFLPTYGVFDEERFVEAGRSLSAFDTRWGRAAMLICEDVWHSLAPTIAALDGAQLLLVPSASPARGILGEGGVRPSSLMRWETLAQDIAGEHGIYLALAQLVGFEGGKGFVGGSLLAGPRGDILAEAPIFGEAVIRGTLDFEEITRARADLPLLADLEMRLPHLMGSLHAARTGAGRRGSGEAGKTERGRDADGTGTGHATPALAPSPARFHPGRDPLAIDPDLTRRWLVEFVRDEVQRRRGFKKAIIGLSGGVDSSLVAFLAVEALGAENVVGVRMPYRTSSPQSG